MWHPAITDSDKREPAVIIELRVPGRQCASCPLTVPNFNSTKPDLTKLPAIGRYEIRGVEIFRTWLHQMGALGTPPAGQSAWTRLLSALAAHTRVIAEQQLAGMRSDGKTFTRDYYEDNKAQDQMMNASAAADVTVCATAAGA
jgi:hypothetical protein